jgi:hypothetical protein
MSEEEYLNRNIKIANTLVYEKVKSPRLRQPKAEHWRSVSIIFKSLVDNGFFYKKIYRGVVNIYLNDATENTPSNIEAFKKFTLPFIKEGDVGHFDVYGENGYWTSLRDIEIFDPEEYPEYYV